MSKQRQGRCRGMRLWAAALLLAFGLTCPVLGLAAGGSEDMVRVRGGSFEMGDAYGGKSQQVVRTVTVRDFAIGRYEVTFDEYDAFCRDTGRSLIRDWGFGRGRRPVIGVSWLDAVAYCNWRSQQEGLEAAYVEVADELSCDFAAGGYRLPTEAEWEYAARSGTKKQPWRYSGSNDSDAVSWHRGNSGGTTHVVGEKQPNELGLYDMSGNAWEWCWDWYDPDYYRENDCDNPTGPAAGKIHVIRGGSWSYYAYYGSPTFRFDYTTSSLITGIGFRLARSGV